MRIFQLIFLLDETFTIRSQWLAAQEQVGSKYIITPGCSVPDASTLTELARFPRYRRLDTP